MKAKCCVLSSVSRLLLVEDDESLSVGIEFALKDEGYDVNRAETLEEGKKYFEALKFDLIILDVNLPDGSGYDLCKYIRTKSDVPVMFLTVLDEEVNIVLGLEIGGDDYITKPFRVKELLSRVKALLRRSTKKYINAKAVLKSGDIAVDTAAALVQKKGKAISLTAQEYKMLLLFMSKPGETIKRDEILSELAESTDIFFDENTLSVYIKRIRQKIENNPGKPDYIVTVRGLGYKWNKDVTTDKNFKEMSE